MYKYIKNIQSKEENVRKQILVAYLVFSMAIVGSVWVYSLTSKFGEKKVAQQTETGAKPFTLFASSISSAYQNISASVANFSLSTKSKDTPEKQIDLIVVEHPAQ